MVYLKNWSMGGALGGWMGRWVGERVDRGEKGGLNELL